MRGNSPVIYWDTCVFLAWITQEQRKPGEMAGIESSVVEIESNRWKLITSAITFAEILESYSGAENVKKFKELFKRPNIASINTDMRIGELAGELKDYYVKLGGKRKLSTPDALHLATAIQYGADEFHTFDAGKKQ
jgi:predicted nucleic acid-binding protein